MNRNKRREAHDAKRAGDSGVLGRIASGNHLSADNDEPEPLSEADRQLARDWSGLERTDLDLVPQGGHRAERFHHEVDRSEQAALQRAIDQRRGSDR